MPKDNAKRRGSNAGGPKKALDGAEHMVNIAVKSVVGNHDALTMFSTGFAQVQARARFDRGEGWVMIAFVSSLMFVLALGLASGAIAITLRAYRHDMLAALMGRHRLVAPVRTVRTRTYTATRIRTAASAPSRSEILRAAA